MRASTVLLPLILVAAAGCQRGGERAEPAGGKGAGRYQGVGVYRAGEMWAQLKAPNAASDPAAARLDDDEEIIVVIDNLTGELRQCGNMSGHCIGMNPWAGSAQPAPATLLKHAADLRREAATPAPAATSPLSPP